VKRVHGVRGRQSNCSLIPSPAVPPQASGVTPQVLTTAQETNEVRPLYPAPRTTTLRLFYISERRIPHLQKRWR
jgi:hypothetical protein